MSGKKTSKRRNWRNTYPTKGEVNTEKSKTMPDMAINPRKIIENHVRGINPITGAVLDRGLYYGENELPVKKDLTYEELRLRRVELERQLNDSKIASHETSSNKTTVPEETGTTTGSNNPTEGGSL
jgi:hypothetical protein